MKVKMILPALTEAKSPFWRPIKYSLFPPLGLATLAAYLRDDDEVEIKDEHVETSDVVDDVDRAAGDPMDGTRTAGCPDLVVIQVYITSAHRAYRSRTRTLSALPPIRRDLIKRDLYLVPNSIVVSRGCPHVCDFCYKEAFFQGGRSFYTQTVEAALAEIDRLPGRHLYFLDDHLFGAPRFASALFEAMRGMGRLWQAAGTVTSVLTPKLIEQAVASGLRSLFVGFETLDPTNLRDQRKYQNLHRSYADAIARLHDLGVMINGSFVFGMDQDDESVFDRTVEWAIGQGIETATFHILTPYPCTALYERISGQGRLLTGDWDLYDTRHAVFRPARMSAEALELGYRRAYRRFYEWRSIARGACTHESLGGGLRHLAYAAGWKKFEPLWDWLIRAKRVSAMLPLLELTLDGGRRDRRASTPPVSRG